MFNLLFQSEIVTQTLKRSRPSSDYDITNGPKRSKTDKVVVNKRFVYILVICNISCVLLDQARVECRRSKRLAKKETTCFEEMSDDNGSMGKCIGGICDRILENHPYGRISHIKYLALKTSLKFLFFVYVWFQYSKNALNYKQKCRNI